MKKLLILFVICALFGCNYQVKNNNIKNDSLLRNETVQKNTYFEENKTVKHERTLEEIFVRSMYLLATKEIPEEYIELINNTSIETGEASEVILFEILAKTDGYTKKEIYKYITKIPARSIRRTECKNEFEYFEVFQTITDEKGKPIGALARGRNYNSYDEWRTFYFPSTFRGEYEMLYDKIKIKPQKNECAVYWTTFSYKNNENKELTVPVVSFVDSRINNPEYLQWAEKLFMDAIEKAKQEETK